MVRKSVHNPKKKKKKRKKKGREPIPIVATSTSSSLDALSKSKIPVFITESSTSGILVVEEGMEDGVTTKEGPPTTTWEKGSK